MDIKTNEMEKAQRFIFHNIYYSFPLVFSFHWQRRNLVTLRLREKFFLNSKPQPVTCNLLTFNLSKANVDNLNLVFSLLATGNPFAIRIDNP